MKYTYTEKKDVRSGFGVGLVELANLKKRVKIEVEQSQWKEFGIDDKR